MYLDFNAIREAASRVFSQGAEKTSVMRLGKVNFVSNGRHLLALEQNPNTGSTWAQLAKSGSKVVQIKDGPKYVAVVVDGQVKFYD